MERIWLKSYPPASPPTSTPASTRRSSRCSRPASASTPTGQRSPTWANRAAHPHPAEHTANSWIDLSTHYGPGATRYAHTRDERVEIAALKRVYETLLAFLRDTV